MVRIRQVKPEFFKDPEMASLTPAVRLFYIGLWMLADDAGYLRVDPATIGIELMGYEPRAKREANVRQYLETLVKADRLLSFPCGHALVPTLVQHQRFGGETKRVYTIKREHERCARESPQPPANEAPRESPGVPATVRYGRGTVGNGSVRLETRGRAKAAPRVADGGASLKEILGPFEDIVGKS